MSKSANKILETAEQLFNKNSFTSVGVDLIRDESGCSKTTMYTYFKNKQQLVEEVLKQRDLHFRARLTQALGTAEGSTAIEKIYDWHIQWFQTDHFKGCLFVRAVAESSSEDEQIQLISIAHKHWIRQLIHQHADPIAQNPLIGETIYLLIEGLISRFLVEGFDATIAMQQRLIILQLLKNAQLLA